MSSEQSTLENPQETSNQLQTENELVRPDQKSDTQSLAEDYPQLKIPYYAKRFIIIGSVFSVITIAIFTFTLINAARKKSELADDSPTPSPSETQSENFPVSQSDPTVYWKDYRSTLFDFKYPNSLGLRENPVILSYFDNSVTISVTPYASSEVSPSYCTVNPNDNSRCKTLLTSSSDLATLDLGDASKKLIRAELVSKNKSSVIVIEMKISQGNKTKIALDDADRKIFTSFIISFKINE